MKSKAKPLTAEQERARRKAVQEAIEERENIIKYHLGVGDQEERCKAELVKLRAMERKA